MTKKKYALFFLLLYFILGIFLTNFINIVIGFVLCGFDWEILMGLLQSPEQYPERRVTLMIIQGIASICSFIVVPIIYLKWYEKTLITEEVSLSFSKNLYLLLLLSGLAIIVYLPFISYTAYWNENIHLPEIFKSFEESIKDKELQLRQITLFLLDFSSFGEFLLGLIVIALIPALGEEFFFRGLLLPRIEWLLKNKHAAVWISAFVFSAFHLQFYGLVPRMMLGVLFGYLYIWVGSFWVPVFVHFFNNAFMLCMVYFYDIALEDMALKAQDSVHFGIALLSLLLTCVLVLYLRKTITKNNSSLEKNFKNNPLFNMEDWRKIYKTDSRLHANIIKNTLESYQIKVVVIDKRDSSYDNFGEREIYVTKDQVIKAIKIIQDEVKFE